MSFTYTANIPVSGQTLNVTRSPINQNFQAINQLVNVNHLGFGATGLGKHKFCELVNQSAIPSPLAAGEGTIYTKSVSGTSQLFYTDATTGNEYQLTRVDTTLFTGKFGASPDGWTFLPGGLILNYGQGTIKNTPVPILFSKPYTTAVLSISGIRHQQNVSTVLGIVSEGINGFTMTTDGNAASTQVFYWMSIGK